MGYDEGASMKISPSIVHMFFRSIAQSLNSSQHRKYFASFMFYSDIYIAFFSMTIVSDYLWEIRKMFAEAGADNFIRSEMGVKYKGFSATMNAE